MSTSDEFGSASSLAPPEVSRVTVRVPPFWRQNPKLWFSQLESQFVTSAITSDTTKYHTLVGSIESSILNHVSHIVENPPAGNKYEALKTALLNEFLESEEKRLRQLLENVTVGDTKPSTLLREMRSLASGKVTEDLLKTLWMQRLPNTTKAILSVSSDTLEKLSLIADKIHDQYDTTTVIEAVSTGNDNRILAIENKIAEVISKIDALTTNKHRRARSTSRRLSHNNSRSSSVKNLCWYHRKFGPHATKCRLPCSFRKSENN